MRPAPLSRRATARGVPARARPGALLLAGALACASDPPPLFVEAPTGALVLAVRSGDAPYALEARERPADGALRARGDEVLVLGYDRSLAALGLPEGPLTRDPAGTPLPAPRWVARAVPGAGAAERLEALPAELEGVRIARPSRCLELVERARFELPVGAGARAAIPLGEDGVLVTTDTDRVLLVREGSADDVTARFTYVPRATGHYDTERRELWMLGTGGRLLHGPVEGPFAEAPLLPEGPHGALALTGSAGGAPFELYAVTATLSVWRFDGGAWDRLRSASGPGPASTELDLSWQAPGLAWATGYGDEELLRIEGRTVTPEWTGDNNPILPSDGLRRVRVTGPAWGLVAGMRSTLRHRRDGAWHALPAPESGSRVYVLAELAGALFFGGEDAVLNQIAPGPRACEAVSWADTLDTTLLALVPLGDGLLTVPRSAAGPAVMKLLVPR